MGYTTVSAKIPQELKEKLRRLNLNVSQFIREALEEEVKRTEEEQLRALAQEASSILQKIPEEEIVGLIRGTREER